jgi:hypothetical protein
MASKNLLARVTNWVEGKAQKALASFPIPSVRKCVLGACAALVMAQYANANERHEGVERALEGFKNKCLEQSQVHVERAAEKIAKEYEKFIKDTNTNEHSTAGKRAMEEYAEGTHNRMHAVQEEFENCFKQYVVANFPEARFHFIGTYEQGFDGEIEGANFLYDITGTKGGDAQFKAVHNDGQISEDPLVASVSNVEGTFGSPGARTIKSPVNTPVTAVSAPTVDENAIQAVAAASPEPEPQIDNETRALLDLIDDIEKGKITETVKETEPQTTQPQGKEIPKATWTQKITTSDIGADIEPEPKAEKKKEQKSAGYYDAYERAIQNQQQRGVETKTAQTVDENDNALQELGSINTDVAVRGNSAPTAQGGTVYLNDDGSVDKVLAATEKLVENAAVKSNEPLFAKREHIVKSPVNTPVTAVPEPAPETPRDTIGGHSASDLNRAGAVAQGQRYKDFLNRPAAYYNIQRDAAYAQGFVPASAPETVAAAPAPTQKPAVSSAPVQAAAPVLPAPAGTQPPPSITPVKILDKGSELDKIVARRAETPAPVVSAAPAPEPAPTVAAQADVAPEASNTIPHIPAQPLPLEPKILDKGGELDAQVKLKNIEIGTINVFGSLDKSDTNMIKIGKTPLAGGKNLNVYYKDKRLYAFSDNGQKMWHSSRQGKTIDEWNGDPDTKKWLVKLVNNAENNMSNNIGR